MGGAAVAKERKPIGFTCFKGSVRGRTVKIKFNRGHFSSKPFYLNPDVQDRLAALGYPKIESVREVNGNTYTVRGWIEGEDLLSLSNRKAITSEILYLYGKEAAKLHQAGFSVWDMVLRNFVYDGERVWLCDYMKLADAPFVEYETLRDIYLNRYFSFGRSLRECQGAFFDGYRSVRPWNTEELFEKTIEFCYSGYQDVYLHGRKILSGARSNKRLSMLIKEDFRDALVLDLGCSDGLLSRFAAGNGARNVVGYDKYMRVFRFHGATFGNFMVHLEGKENIHFECLDIESARFVQTAPKADVVFFCAMLGHIAGDRNKYMRFVDSLATKVLYYEGNLHVPREKCELWLRSNTTFTKIDYLGESGDLDRKQSYALFRCER